MAVNPFVIISLTSSMSALSAAYLIVVERRERINRARFAGIVNAYRPGRSMEPSLRRAASGGGEYPAWFGLLNYLGIRANRPDLYPLAWWAILLITTLFALGVVKGGSVLIGPIAWATAPIVWVVLVRTIFKRYEDRRNRTLYLQLPDALAMIVRSVRVGVTVQESLRVVSEEGMFPTSIEFKRLVDELRVGAALGEALNRLAARTGLIEYRFFAVALSLQNQSGGSLSETLENLADVIRKRVALRARAIALAAEARLTMYVLAGLPFVTILALSVIQPEYLTVLVTTTMGKYLAFTGIVLLSLGLFSMQFIIKKSTT